MKNLNDLVKCLLATHSHRDHIGMPNASTELKRETGASLAANKTDPDRKHGDIRLDDGDDLQLGAVAIKVLYTPGHTDDTVCFLVDGRSLITGDTLYVGRARNGELRRQLFDSLHDCVLKRCFAKLIVSNSMAYTTL